MSGRTLVAALWRRHVRFRYRDTTGPPERSARLTRNREPLFLGVWPLFAMLTEPLEPTSGSAGNLRLSGVHPTTARWSSHAKRRTVHIGSPDLVPWSRMRLHLDRDGNGNADERRRRRGRWSDVDGYDWAGQRRGHRNRRFRKRGHRSRCRRGRHAARRVGGKSYRQRGLDCGIRGVVGRHRQWWRRYRRSSGKLRRGRFYRW